MKLPLVVRHIPAPAAESSTRILAAIAAEQQGPAAAAAAGLTAGQASKQLEIAAVGAVAAASESSKDMVQGPAAVSDTAGPGQLYEASVATQTSNICCATESSTSHATCEQDQQQQMPDLSAQHFVQIVQPAPQHSAIAGSTPGTDTVVAAAELAVEAALKVVQPAALSMSRITSSSQARSRLLALAKDGSDDSQHSGKPSSPPAAHHETRSQGCSGLRCTKLATYHVPHICSADTSDSIAAAQWHNPAAAVPYPTALNAALGSGVGASKAAAVRNSTEWAAASRPHWSPVPPVTQLLQPQVVTAV